MGLYKITAVLLFTFFLLGSSEAQSRKFEVVGEDVDIPELRAHSYGQYIQVRPVGRSDTLSLWVEGVTRERGPSWARAFNADIVLWCYPEKYSIPTHVLPSAERILVITESYNRKRWVNAVSEKTARRTGLIE